MQKDAYHEMALTAETVETVRPDPAAAAGRLPRRHLLWRAAAQVAWVLGLAAFLVLRVGRFGFNPSDEGFVLSQSWRILQGEIPHVDIVSARPLGSAYLHVVDFALPAPLFLSSGFVSTVELIVATVACAALVTRRSPLQWGPLRTFLVAAAAVINVHTFLMMAWHTIDGIFLTAVGWWMLDAGLRAGSAWRRRFGLFLLGFAVMTKQSFMFAVPVGILLLLFHPDVDLRACLRDRRWWLQSVIDLVCLGAFPLLYAGYVTAAGGLRPMIHQVTGGQGAWGQNLYDFWFSGPFVVGDIRRHILMTAACVVVAAVLWLLRGRLGKVGVWARLLPLAGAALVTVYALYRTHLVYPATWSIKFLWLLLAAIALDALVHKHLPWRPLLIVLLGYMASLSWGYNYPGLVTGTLVLTTLELLVEAAPEIRLRGRGWLVPQAVVGVVALLAACFLLVDQHDRQPPVDMPRADLTADLGAVTPAMHGIRTTSSTATYVAQIAQCIRRYPASDVAVLPDNPFVYAAFKLHNPFPMDWPLPMELVGDSPQRMLDTVTQLNRHGNYLVLFETIPWSVLRAAPPVPAHVPVDAPIVVASGLENQIHDGLTGEKVSCGSFVGVWSPKR